MVLKRLQQIKADILINIEFKTIIPGSTTHKIFQTLRVNCFECWII